MADPNAQDLQFLEEAAFLNSQDIADGLLASQLSPSFAVRQYGVQEVTDHLSLNSLLQSVVTQEGLPEPPQLSALFQTQMNYFESVYGPNSDAQYLNKEVAVSRQSLLIYQNEVVNGEDPLLKSYAQGSLPILQAELNQATALLNSHHGFGV